MAKLLGHGGELVDEVLDVLQGFVGPTSTRRHTVTTVSRLIGSVGVLPRSA
jgi:hypothetical protein